MLPFWLGALLATLGWYSQSDCFKRHDNQVLYVQQLHNFGNSCNSEICNSSSALIATKHSASGVPSIFSAISVVVSYKVCLELR